jgi:opacity protein-like surface antigen
MRGALVAALTVLTPMTMPSTVRADSFVIPFIGINFGGSTGNTFDIEDAGDPNRTAFGVAVGYLGGGFIGGELDVSYTHHFFGDGPSVSGNSLLTVMPAVIIAIPVGGQSGGGFRPYGIAGIGMTRRDLTLDTLEVFDDADLAYSLGAGVTVYFSDHVGVNAEYRYLRNFEVDEISIEGVDLDRSTFSFSRVGFGVAFRF